MRMMDELKHLYLYSAKKKVYIPIDDKDRKKNSAIMLLTTSLEKSVELTRLPYIYNPGLFSSFYINRDVMAYIGNDVDIKDFDENEEESISEAMVSSNDKAKFTFKDYIIDSYINESSDISFNNIKNIVSKISKNRGSNNCQLCASCFELQLRGIPAYPRSVNTPRDIVFKTDSNWTFLKNGRKINLRKDLKTHVKEILNSAGDGSRFYCHNGWKGSTGGHVFNIINYKDDIYIIDCQAGKTVKIDDDNLYLNSNKVDYTRCYLIRTDNKEIDIEKIKYNNPEYAIPWKDGDEKYLESVSESMISSSGRTKFRFEDGTSIMDKKYIEKVFNHRTVSEYSKLFRLGRIPEGIKVFVHPNKSNLQKDAPKDLLKLHKDRLYSYSKNDEIHVISKLAYDEELMGGPYDLYLTAELLCSMIMQYNPNTHFIPVKAIVSVVSKQYQWKLENDNNIVSIDSIDKLCKTIKIAEDKKDINIISKYIKTADINVFKKYAASIVISDIKSLLFESSLSYFERQRLLPSEFGIPDKRKYPMPDEEHVRLAIKMFNNCDYDEEEELAKAIIKKIDKFGIKDVKVSAANRFRKYYKPQKVNESFINSQYADILKICSHLSGDEFKKISFYDTYRDSQFVIKRIIKYVGGEPAGFLDVYLFPSKPDIAQIVIAVDERFRGLRVADTMVKELLSSDLASKYNFSVYYWTAHFDNEASQNLALKNGFVDTDTVDKYGRKVYTLSVRQNKDVIPDIDRERFISNEFAVLNEANDNSTYKLKQYLYAERIKNNTEVLKMYDKVKSLNPNITRTYNRLEMYKGFNLFVDLSYYHSLYLKNSTYKYDKAVSFYFDFINKMINNDSINSMYKKQTIFIPVEGWPIQPMSDMTDFRKNLNPISIILRLIRTDSQALRTAWKNKDIIFVGSKGYFKIDFNLLETKDINRLKTNIKKLTTVGEVIEDDYELDELDDNEDTSKAINAKIVDKIDKGTGVNVSVTSIDDVEPISKASLLSYGHLEMIPNNISIDNMGVDDGIILLVNPEDEIVFKESTNMNKYSSNLNSNLYFLSETNMNEMILHPRIPNNFLTMNGYEDNTTPRVCFCTSIDNCLMAMSMRLTDKEFYVHRPIEKYSIYSPSIKEVPDVKITGEKWIKEPVKLSCIGKIRVTGPARCRGIDYIYGDNKIATLYRWSWEKIEGLD